MDGDGRMHKVGCSHCGFINAAWNNGSLSKNISANTSILFQSQPHAPSFNLTQQSSQKCSFEGIGGNASMLDPLDMQQKIAELEFQLRKLTEEKSELQEQLMTMEDEKVALQCQKEDSDKKQNLNKANIERLRELSLELEDTKNILASLEDKNVLLSSKVHQLDKENQELVLQKDAAIRDVRFHAVTCTQLNSYRKQLQMKKSEYSMLEEELKEEIKHLCAKKIEYEIEFSDLHSKLNHLEATNDHLLRENQELLKHSKVDKAGLNQYAILNDAFGVEDDSTSNNEEVPKAISFTNSCLICKVNKNSLYAEISAVMPKKDLSADKTNLKKLLEIFIVLQKLRQLVVSGSSNTREPVFIEETLPAVEKAVAQPAIETNNEILNAQLTQNDIDTAREEVVRRINEELAEFREQLKMSQELFHALSNSAQNVNVTQSCPLLAETETPKFVDCSTQTSVINENQHSFYMTNNCHDVENDMDGQDEDKLSDDISYRLTINLPTVLEESEQETETSPATAPRVMSSKKGSRRLVRGNATEDDKADDEIKSDNEYASAVSSPPGSKSASVYNSLERPLHVSGLLSNSPGRRDLDTASINSGGSTTTFGSPLSSPSSPTYWTPSQGSSSQETITNHDGDKTPVNEDYGNIIGDADLFPKSSSSNGIGPHSSSWMSQKENTLNDYPVGVIPECKRAEMQQYAFDPVKRGSEKEAGILERGQWRTLKKDLNKQTHENYMKDFAQEEGHDGDGGLNYCDLDEEAEEYFEMIPHLVEGLFSSLDHIKDKDTNPSESQLHDISKRFRNLVQLFKTEHTTISQRFEQKKTEHENSRRRMKDICDSLKTAIQKSEVVTKSQKSPDESNDILVALKDTSQELEMHFVTLSRSARRLGMLDVERRMYKMIEVMVLYVHILNNLKDNLKKEYSINRKLLEEHNINVKSEESFGQLHNNNNGTVRSIENDDPSETFDSCEDGKPKKILEGLLTQRNLRNRQPLGEEKSSNNVVVRNVAEWYEVFRRELYWPWSWDQTWKGIKQGFSIILMLIGLFIILKSLFPAVSANECAPMYDLASVFSKHGSLSYNHRPPI